MAKKQNRRDMAKKQYSAAEKVAFKRGMAAQYNKEHPKFSYAVADKITSYAEDGSIFTKPYYGKPAFFKTKKEAEKAVEERNKSNHFQNQRVLNAVKKKKVNIYDSSDNTTTVAELKHITPTRDVGFNTFMGLTTVKKNKK